MATAGRLLDGRVALVTGASRGIGSRSRAGWPTRARRSRSSRARSMPSGAPGSPGSLSETAAAIATSGGRSLPIVANLADPADRARIVPAVEAALGPVDVLVHNAAAAIYAPTAEMPLRRRQTVFEVNVHAAIDLAQAVLPAAPASAAGS